MGFPGTKYQEFIYKRSYARWVDSAGRRENLDETVERYRDYMLHHLTNFGAPRSALEAFSRACDFIRTLDVMPSMRALWTAGTALERENMAGYNCAYLEINHPRQFAELLYVLMNGTGVGFSVERQVIDALPPIPAELSQSPDEVVFADSKRGWAEGLYEFLRALWSGKIPKYNLSMIRPKGSRLKTFGGRASGPEPVQELLEYCKALFLSARGRKLNSLECHDLCCKVASVVMVGGVRRSACISLSNLSDDRMAKAKSGDWWTMTPWRQFANNSVAYTEKPDARKFVSEWLKLIESQSGERGVFNRPAAEFSVIKTGRREAGHRWGLNPCVTGDTIIQTAIGPIPIGWMITLSGVDVYSMDHDGRVVLRKAHDIRLTSGRAKILRVVTPAGVLRCTPNHPIAVRRAGGGVDWVSAGELAPGDRLCRLHGGKIVSGRGAAVVAVEDHGEEEPVYNMEVEGTHNYIAGGLVVHNCGEIILRPNQTCNLSEAVIKPDDSLDDIREKVWAAVVLGVAQSTLTNFKFLSRAWRKNCEEERLLGVSMTGLMDHPMFNRLHDGLAPALDRLKYYAIDVARGMAESLRIRMPAAITCVKPSGTVSQLVGSSSGLHARYAPYYIRRVQVSADDPLCGLLIAAGVPHHPAPNEQHPDRPSSWSFEFPLQSPEGSVCKDQLSALQQLDYWMVIKEHWTEHNPSCTIYVRDDEWMEVGAWVYRHWHQVCGLSFLPVDTNVYVRPPYEEIDEETFRRLSNSFPDIDFDRLSEFERHDTTDGSREYACSSGSCDL